MIEINNRKFLETLKKKGIPKISESTVSNYG